jgi:hypothetical protein
MCVCGNVAASARGRESERGCILLVDVLVGEDDAGLEVPVLAPSHGIICRVLPRVSVCAHTAYASTVSARTGAEK